MFERPSPPNRHRAEDDYLINLKAELEVRHLHRKLHCLTEQQAELVAQQRERFHFLLILLAK